MRLRAAAVGIAIITSGLVLSVAGNANAQTVAHAPRITHAAVVKPRFDVICSGDVCIQTTSKNATTASVRTWPDTVSFTGHFELVNGCGGVFGNSTEGDKFYQSGGTGFTFSGIHWADCMDHWKMIGWQKNAPNNYSKVGTVSFSI